MGMAVGGPTGKGRSPSLLGPQPGTERRRWTVEGRGGPLGPELACLGQAQPHGSLGAKRCPIPLVARLTLAIPAPCP